METLADNNWYAPRTPFGRFEPPSLRVTWSNVTKRLLSTQLTTKFYIFSLFPLCFCGNALRTASAQGENHLHTIPQIEILAPVKCRQPAPRRRCFRRKHEQTPRIIAGQSTRQSINSVRLIPSHSLNALADRICCSQHKQRRRRRQTKESGWHLSAIFQRVFGPCRGRLIDLSAKESALSSAIWHLDYGET